MSPLRPNPIRNRQLIAQRLRWPQGALEECAKLEQDFPRWNIYWSATGVPGYHAHAELQRQPYDVFGETVDALRLALTVADPQLPPPAGLSPYRSLGEIPRQRCYGTYGSEDDECEYRWPHGEHPVGEEPARG